MAVELRCPECRAKLKLDDAPDAGTDIECPKCGTTFVAPEPADDEGDDRPKKKKSDDRPKKDRERDGAGEGKKKDKPAKGGADPKAPKKRKSKKRETSKGLLVGVIVAGLVMLACVTGLLVYLLGRTPKSVEMMHYVPEDADSLSGLNLGHAQKYPEFYKALSGTFGGSEFKLAGDGIGRAIGANDLDGLADHVLFGSNSKGHSAMVFRTKSEFNADGLGKLPGAKQQSLDGRTYYAVDGFSSGAPRTRVFAPTNRLVVVCPQDVPEPVFKKILSGNAGSQDKTAGSRMGELGKRVTRGTFWSLQLFQGDSKPPAAPAASKDGAGGSDDGKAQLARTIAETLSGSKGYGLKASIGSREVRFEVVVWYADSEKASSTSRKWKESDLGKGDEGTPPRWWKSEVDPLGNKIKAQMLANIGCGSSGDLFYARSSVESADLKESVSNVANKFNPRGGSGGGGGGAGMPPPGGPAGPAPGGPGPRPGGPKPRRRVRACR
ncbi:hypothetical protein GobsT_06750 [Gemmata obscuriglobus]|uniref:Zinc finger/thioredoxin putative domain-containing protein n=1 Tax=Gemmata obscuriglobus TaxID=114 RepID=A0A2Z3HHA6_9BACT|nr:hypothetical protein [Gemmata obscuriglobus]AWM40780.1 hypothetical protein C1280_29870 [Gemmata obscuriglobus]QEG25940.1 hypothetical protein GobsT_06750 [Gemmata obscuriglobus]VTS00101.1 : zinc_ribbon_5 [Gemmata obscuriglobus UQM 2246]